MWLPMSASVEVLAGTLMAMSGGKLIIALLDSQPYDIVGVLRHKIDSTDADYATDLRLVEIEVPVEKNVEWEIDSTIALGGTLVVADIGLYMDILTANGTTTSTYFNRALSSYDTLRCVGLISTTKGRFVLNIGADARLKAAS